ncbi:hypothetical protein [Burkholderia pseudomallei]|uniref:hypothetical protein n=1 Tax=Burkholderia pseudomallei TaxID=28450 RepID=UPI00061BBE73|nr:hypothetical protein [Burkholderia pseudomallei]CPF06304.1 Uncharacterised protein [Burkholderia pseudomallei]VBE58948.1 Uncharacterised protein [Burkholderia pseudomallei]VBK19805.1 Uncharacterised protein [Burkholderia pseudomallei]VBO76826.1 Uncharacterised protein [Burkholderia pseudomallei]VBR85533.1 Uncharacterised protein [Burkholderia pseudomallei]
MLESYEFASSNGLDAPPSDLVDQDVWDGIMHLPEDVSIRTSNHNGIRLRLMYSLWGDWIQTVGNPLEPDEIFENLLSAGECFQCSTFNFLHGYYRAAIAELRTALELVMIGAYGSLFPMDRDYVAWKEGSGDLTFGRCRSRLLGNLRKEQAKWMFENGNMLAVTYQALCNFSHSRPDASDGALWRSNGPVFNSAATRLTFVTTLSVYAMCYLLIRLARNDSAIPEGSNILFELDWMPDYQLLKQAYTDLYGRPPAPPLG